MAQPSPAAAPGLAQAAPLIEAYGVFVGNIDQDAVRRIMNSLAIATNPATRIGQVHLLLQTVGGSVGDSVALYNFFRTLPVGLTLYNVGSVQSGGVIAYLGAQRRRVSTHATFMIHRTSSPAVPAQAPALQGIAKSVALDDARIEAILRSRIKLTDEEWANIDKQQLWFSADEAVKNGMADEIAEFAPPKGSQVFSV